MKCKKNLINKLISLGVIRITLHSSDFFHWTSIYYKEHKWWGYDWKENTKTNFVTHLPPRQLTPEEALAWTKAYLNYEYLAKYL